MARPMYIYQPVMRRILINPIVALQDYIAEFRLNPTIPVMIFSQGLADHRCER